MPYDVGDTEADQYGITRPTSTSTGLQTPSLKALPTPGEAYQSYWRQVSQVPSVAPAAQAGYGVDFTQERAPAKIGFRGSMSDFDSMQLSDIGPDTIRGGLSPQSRALLDNPVRYSAYTPAPPLAPATRLAQQGLGKPGDLQLDMIQPFTSLQQATGPFLNPWAQQNIIGNGGDPSLTGFDPMKFLAERNVGLLENAPSRALDYLFAPLNVALRHLTGGGIAPATTGDGLVKYAFQKDPTYWQWVSGSSAAMLTQQARIVANGYAPGWQNQGLQAQLEAQFKRDKETMLGLSSGDEAIDYRAKQHMIVIQRDFSREGGESIMEELAQVPSVFLPAIPIIGTQLGEFIDPIKPETQAAWEALDPRARASLLQTAGMQQMVLGTIATLPVFSGVGTVVSFGARAAAGTYAANAFKVYSVGMDVLTQAMKAGVGVALLNWSAEIAVPGYTDFLGRQIDEARPVSSSPIGAAVNAIGYFASPTDVLGPYLGLLKRPVKAVLGGAMRTIPIFEYGLGGVAHDNLVTRAYTNLTTGEGLAAGGFATSAKRLALSYMHTVLQDSRVAFWKKAIAEGDPEGNFPSHITTLEDRLQYATDDLRNMGNLSASVEALTHVIEEGKTPAGFKATASSRLDRNALKSVAQTWEDRIAHAFVTDYGPEFWTREVQAIGKPSLDPDGMAGWLQAQADRMSWSVDMGRVRKSLGNDLDRWMSFGRKMYHAEFDHLNGTLQAAAEGAGEAGRVILVRNTHLFSDMADELRGALELPRGADEATVARARDLAWRRITETEELSRWWAELTGKKGAPLDKSKAGLSRGVLKRLASEIDLMRDGLMERRQLVDPASPTATEPLNAFHLKTASENIWTLAHKAKFRGEDGAVEGATSPNEPQFASIKSVGDGRFIQSPYLDYPMESADLVKLGGQGWLATKADGLTRAWRSWRIGQFQRGSLFRHATRYEGVSAAQAQSFFEGVEDIARTKTYGGELTGMRISTQAASRAFATEIRELGERVFGKGELRNLDTGAMERPDWSRVVQRAFQQSTKLNLTAGITSRFKAMPNKIGDGALMTSDVIVPLLRFGLSPAFKVGEYIESKMLNAMRMGFENVDPLARSLYVRAGVTRERNAMAHEMSADPAMAGNLIPTLDKAPRPQAMNFLTPTRDGRPIPEEAAAADQPPPGIDMPGGPDAPARARTPADSTMAEYQDAMQDVFSARQADAEMAVDPEWMRAVEARYEAARDSLNAQHTDSWQQARDEYQARMDDFWESHGQPAQPTPTDTGPVAALRDAEAELNRATEATMASPDDFDAASRYLDASERYQQAREELRTTGPAAGTELADMPGQAEHVDQLIDQHIAAEPSPSLRDRLKSVWSPQSMKEEASHALTIKMMGDMLPAVLKASGSRVVGILRELHVPESDWAEYLIADKLRLQEVQNAGGTPESWQRLFDHAGKEPAAAADMAELMASPEWNVVSHLWLATEQAARDEAFGVHFFARYRSTAARSINHPLLGVYPAAWAYKAAKEWFRFLYDNRAFGEGHLRLGMAPAVAIAHIEDSQNRLLAMSGMTTDDLIGSSSPFGSGLFLFNLLLPGDWSGIPFPMSRSIRMMMRGDFNPVDHILQNFVGGAGVGGGAGMGGIRDLRLASETGAAIYNMLQTKKSPGQTSFDQLGSILSNEGTPRKPKGWDQLASFPAVK